MEKKTSAAAVLTTHGVTVAYKHPTPIVPAQEWACAGIAPEQFFPEDDATLAAAQVVCGTCPVRELCLSLGVARRESGVWGGQLLEGGVALEAVPVKGRPRKRVAA